MRFAALAVDYDGTLASQGVVSPETVEALRRLAASGRKLLLVTGRELDELIGVFPEIRVFDRVVAENGALLYCPRTGVRKPLGMAPPPEFVAELTRRGVEPLSVGRSIVATVTPHETAVLDTIRELGLELQVIFNKGAVMVLPAGVNKASGLAAGLDDLGLSPRNVAAIGDAENDHALLRSAEFGVAVANALPTLKRDADRSSDRSHGDAVAELIDAILADDLRAWTQSAHRRDILLGYGAEGAPVTIAPAGCDVLLAGPSGSGKSVYAAAVFERLAQLGYQYCVIDPEGDYADLPGAVVLGGGEREPSQEEIATALSNPHTNLVINLSGLAASERPIAFKELAPRLAGLRATHGRPHWLLVGEAHQLFSAGDADVVPQSVGSASSTLYVTVHPEAMHPNVLASIETVIAVGANHAESLQGYCAALGESCPQSGPAALRPGEAFAWMRRGGDRAFVFAQLPSEAERRQHRRRVVEGQLSPERSFYFRGARRSLNLRAQNLPLFLQIGLGVDEETWLHHLRQGDYSRWLQEAVKDPALAREVAAIEKGRPDADSSRREIAAILEKVIRSGEGHVEAGKVG